MRRAMPCPSPRILLFVASALLAALLGGCVHAPLNQPLTRYDQKGGYRFANRQIPPPGSDVTVILFFSGGGKRAAALSYGVLRELAATPAAGGSQRLLDSVEMISAVSGGSFTAACYALHHDGIFEDYEKGFLKDDTDAALIGRVFWPTNWPSLSSPYYGRSDLAADYYDRHLFDGATFGDLVRAGNRPFVLINATDMANGEQFTFTQIRFDLIGSDLSAYPLARAVAASSATPLLLTPITLQNHAGAAGQVQSVFLPDSGAEDALSARAREIRQVMRSYTDAKHSPYIHLMDGGLSDNLGMRSLMDAALLRGGLVELAERIGMPVTNKVALVVVNAAAHRGAEWAQREDVPGVFRAIDQLGDNIGTQVNRHTLVLFRQILEEWKSEMLHRHAMTGAPGSQLPDYYLVDVMFDQLTDPGEKAFFQNLPTRLTLPDDTIDKLTAVGGRLLRESPEFQRLLRDLNQPAGIVKN